MENADLVLDFIANNEKVTQRKISKGTNLSLGNINLILKRSLEKGLIKIEKINRNNVKYLLTPMGIFEKSAYAYDYLQNAFKRLSLLKANLDIIIKSQVGENKKVVFFGSDDEIKLILKDLVLEYNLPSVLWTSELDEVLKLNDVVLILWQPEALRKCWQSDLNYIDMLNTTKIEKMP